MKAYVVKRYGPPEVLQRVEIEKPVPKDDEVLIKLLAATVTSGDWRVRSLHTPPGFTFLMRLALGFSKPRQPILGTELAGVVESVGKAVRNFKPGDEVFAFTDMAMGCWAEYRCVPETSAIALKPANLTFDEAATLSFGGTTVLHFFRKANLKRGESVLINGASGGVGTAAVQLAKHIGAHVTAVCSGANGEMVRSLGAGHVIDYTKEDFTRSGRTYDVILDVAGTAPFHRVKSVLNEGGRLVLVQAGLGDTLRAPLQSMTGGKKVLAGPASSSAEDLRFLAELATAGTYKPVIDRRYPFDQIVEAHRYVDTGRKRGNVVLTFASA